MSETYRELCNNSPWMAIKAMLDGLHTQHKGFEINMGTYGIIDVCRTNTCYGCAASVTLATLSKQPVREVIIERKNARVEYYSSDQYEFEYAIDAFRIGSLISLEKYFNCKLPRILNGWFLNTDTWRTEVKAVIAYYELHTGTTYCPPVNKIERC